MECLQVYVYEGYTDDSNIHLFLKGNESQKGQELYKEEQSPVTDNSTYGDHENVSDEDQQLPPAGIATYEDQMNANSSAQGVHISAILHLQLI